MKGRGTFLGLIQSMRHDEREKRSACAQENGSEKPTEKKKRSACARRSAAMNSVNEAAKKLHWRHHEKYLSLVTLMRPGVRAAISRQ